MCFTKWLNIFKIAAFSLERVFIYLLTFETFVFFCNMEILTCIFVFRTCQNCVNQIKRTFKRFIIEFKISLTDSLFGRKFMNDLTIFI